MTILCKAMSPASQFLRQGSCGASAGGPTSVWVSAARVDFQGWSHQQSKSLMVSLETSPSASQPGCGFGLLHA
eukprot:11182424-Lingulodinium_polyedra.AAC.1